MKYKKDRNIKKNLYNKNNKVKRFIYEVKDTIMALSFNFMWILPHGNNT